jgi:plastocyanin domain-containing protein
VRAERERLGLRAHSAAAPSSSGPKQTEDRRQAETNVQTAKVLVGEKGYEPARVSLRAGTPAQVTFVRITDKTCGTEVVFPSLNIKRALPLNEPVVIAFTPSKTGEISFVCGMNMLRGTVAVQ